ncbi:MAG TPA: glutamate-5-semialdehyde dehydrogenase [Bacteroidales bacterium]|nr:glutamate-5-semialdehyde dehydrogenase [Bacteroidales bacterium]
MEELINIGKKAREASYELAHMKTSDKNKILSEVAKRLKKGTNSILEANEKDLNKASEMGLKGAIVDRLTLTEDRISGIAEGLQQIVRLEDPVGEVMEMKKRPNGLIIGKQRVPLGVVGVIYESRPNVTADVGGLCLKTGNVCVLRGGKEAFHSNKIIVDLFREVIGGLGYNQDMIQLVTDTSRESAKAMMRLNNYLDILIPRGGAGLIQAVVENSSVPVIETGVGNCHVFVDASADLSMATDIVVNSKTHRPGVCNAAESLVIHEDIAEEAIPQIGKALMDANVEVRGDEIVCGLLNHAKPASEDDWSAEYLDNIISVKVVPSLEKAIAHIHTYGSNHSESIFTSDYGNAQFFLDMVDAAAVYVNASTRFTDGFEFGYGAEIGISTQKLHARGPMGLKELTTSKYIIYGSGQIRN